MNFYLPKKRKKEKMGLRDSAIIRSRQHLVFVRSFVCSIMDKNGHVCDGKVEAAHVRTLTDGGTGLKPSDCFSIPLCSAAHREQHQIGESAFETKYQIKMRAIADKLWSLSKHRLKYQQRHS